MLEFEVIGSSFVLVMCLMVLFWIIQYTTNKIMVVDIGWALGFTGSALISLLLGHGYWLRRTLIVLMFVIWSLRLANHLYERWIDYQKTDSDDPRYVDLRKQWTPPIQPKILGLFLFQGLSVLLLSIPLYISTADKDPSISWLSWFSILLWAASLAGEATADNQLKEFKKNPDSKGKICQVGLWRYSRHPNYFFEWMTWVSFALFAWSSPGGFFALYSPAVLLYLLLRITGIPLVEARALGNYGTAYRIYQETTSTFVPWFPKEETKEDVKEAS